MRFASVFSTIACSRIASLRDNDRFAWIFLAQSTEAAADRSALCSFSFACYFRGHGDINQHINASEFQMILQIALIITQTHIDNRIIQSFGASRGSRSNNTILKGALSTEILILATSKQFLVGMHEGQTLWMYTGKLQCVALPDNPKQRSTCFDYPVFRPALI